MMQTLWKTIRWFLTKLDIFSLYNLATALLVIYPEKMKIYVHTEIHTQTAAFTATFFLIAKTQKQPACLLAGE